MENIKIYEKLIRLRDESNWLKMKVIDKEIIISAFGSERKFKTSAEAEIYVDGLLAITNNYKLVYVLYFEEFKEEFINEGHSLKIEKKKVREEIGRFENRTDLINKFVEIRKEFRNVTVNIFTEELFDYTQFPVNDENYKETLLDFRNTTKKYISVDFEIVSKY